MARGDGTVSRSWLVAELAVGLRWWFDGKTVGMRLCGKGERWWLFGGSGVVMVVEFSGTEETRSEGHG